MNILRWSGTEDIGITFADQRDTAQAAKLFVTMQNAVVRITVKMLSALLGMPHAINAIRKSILAKMFLKDCSGNSYGDSRI